MKQPFEVKLTGTDTLVDGIVKQINYGGFQGAWEFKSIDGSVHFVIAKDEDGNWMRVAGTDPYLSGWIDELIQQLI